MMALRTYGKADFAQKLFFRPKRSGWIELGIRIKNLDTNEEEQ